MKLLLLTQKVDKNDPVLGFFHRWLEELAKHFEKLTVICLEKGEFHLPGVEVLSLGKEEGESVFKYLFRFYKYIWQERSNYDSVFVHMNQEYVLLGTLAWFFGQKPVYLWRNHAKGNLRTRLAVLLSEKVFCTSPQSFTAKYKKTRLMPVGIDTEFFKPDSMVKREAGTVLFLGRIAPVKRVIEFVDWLKDHENFTATVAGEALPKDNDYLKSVKDKVKEYELENRVKFIGAVNSDQTLGLYRTHECYVNLTLSGSLDKTILEAAACGTKVVVRNDFLKHLEGKDATKLRDFVVENHSLDKLMNLLEKSICKEG